MKRSIPLSALLLVVACAPAPEPSSTPTGELLYRRQGCTQCHGTVGMGGSLGPPLRALGANWSREQLAAYFSDPPASIADRPHLRELSERFDAQMPSIRATEEERLALADYVLGLSASN